jgi:hypothetical protein
VTRPRRRSPQLLVSLLLTVVLAVGLGFVIYSSVTSLPYLAVVPTTDPVFGALNSCVLRALEERTGFAPSRDASRLAAWSPAALVVCGPGESTPGVSLRAPGVTVGAWDGAGRLWVASRSADAAHTRLAVLEAGALREVGQLEVQALAGTAGGVVVLEPGGRLVSLSAPGGVAGTHHLPNGELRAAALSTSADGERVAVVVGGGVFAFTSGLELLRAEAPCEVERLWWPALGHRALLECRAEAPLALSFDVDTGETSAVAARARAPATLVGPAGVWFQSCDVLPCTAEPP